MRGGATGIASSFRQKFPRTAGTLFGFVLFNVSISKGNFKLKVGELRPDVNNEPGDERGKSARGKIDACRKALIPIPRRDVSRVSGRASKKQAPSSCSSHNMARRRPADTTF